MEDKTLTEKESLEIITNMIHKAKKSFHESGTSAILWGSVTGFCGLFSYAQQEFDFTIGFDIWFLTLAAIIPQIWISIRERKRKQVETYQESATDIVWTVYIFSIIGIVLYGIFVPGVSDRFFQEEGIQLLSKDVQTGVVKEWHVILPSMMSIYLIVYAFPTLATGLINHFNAMIWGAVFCYLFFIASLFTPFKYDLLLAGFAGIFNWLVPGFILRRQYLNAKTPDV